MHCRSKSGPIPSTGPLPATVPAVLGACITALNQFGTRDARRSDGEPAIELADGFPIDELRVEYIKTRSPIFSSGQMPNAYSFLEARCQRLATCLSRQIWLAPYVKSSETNDWQRKAKRNRHAGLLAARDYFYRGPMARESATTCELMVD